MQSSTWRAHGNTYVVAELDDDRLDAARAAALARDADGVLEILASGDDRVEIAIWNPDGSQAELSGNGTRIAAAWLASRTDTRRIDVVVGNRSVETRILEDGAIEQDLGLVVVGAPETIDGITFTPVSVGNPPPGRKKSVSCLP